MNKWIENFDSLKIRTKLLILLAIVGLVPIAVLGTTLTINAHNMVMENRKADMERSLTQAGSMVTSQVAICEQMMNYLASDYSVISFLKCSPKEQEKQSELYQDMCKIINAIEFQNLVMRKITVYSESITNPLGKETASLDELKEQSWFSQIKDAKNDEITWIYDDKNLSMLAIRKMTNFKENQSYVVVTCNIQSLLQSFEPLGIENQGVILLGEKEIWNYYDNKDFAYFKQDMEKNLCVTQEIPKLGMKAVYYTPKKSVEKFSKESIIYTILRILLCIIIILILGRLFANYISKPIELLTTDIQNVDSNNMKVNITSNRKDEIGSLIQSYHHMMQRINDLIQENYQVRISQKEFEMKALQAQINPHFLYNSLSIINWKAIEANEMEISRITLTLSNFYRTTLNKGKTFNTIRNAVENIKSYVNIQLCIHDNNFQVHYDIDEEVLEYEIPVLIFQPFVENALEHGLDIKEDADHQMWIEIGKDEKDIMIKISDNGVGMTPEEKDRILTYDSNGYGVKNVNDRLKLHYGKEYHLIVESIPNVKTTITLRIPIPVKPIEG